MDKRQIVYLLSHALDEGWYVGRTADAILTAQGQEGRFDSSVSRCVGCGIHYHDDPGGVKVKEHIKGCADHPIFIAEARVQRLTEALETTEGALDRQNSYGGPREWICHFCPTKAYGTDGSIEHTLDCPISKARAVLEDPEAGSPSVVG